MRARLATVILGVLLGAACLVDVRHVSDPQPAFRKARAEAEALAGREGPARSVQVLVYDPAEQELVRVSVPMWLAKRLAKEIVWDDDEGDPVARALKGRLTLQDLERSALGTLIEVEEEDGEQVMVWLR
jgi:hypothetical protein